MWWQWEGSRGRPELPPRRGSNSADSPSLWLGRSSNGGCGDKPRAPGCRAGHEGLRGDPMLLEALGPWDSDVGVDTAVPCLMALSLKHVFAFSVLYVFCLEKKIHLKYFSFQFLSSVLFLRVLSSISFPFCFSWTRWKDLTEIPKLDKGRPGSSLLTQEVRTEPFFCAPWWQLLLWWPHLHRQADTQGAPHLSNCTLRCPTRRTPPASLWQTAAPRWSLVLQ